MIQTEIKLVWHRVMGVGTSMVDWRFWDSKVMPDAGHYRQKSRLKAPTIYSDRNRIGRSEYRVVRRPFRN